MAFFLESSIHVVSFTMAFLMIQGSAAGAARGGQEGATASVSVVKALVSLEESDGYETASEWWTEARCSESVEDGQTKPKKCSPNPRIIPNSFCYVLFILFVSNCD